MIIFDAHNHLQNYPLPIHFSSDDEYSCISCCGSEKELESLEKIETKLNEGSLNFGAKTVKIYKAFGIHPWVPDETKIEFLERLIKNRRIDMIGECGLDFYTDERKKLKNEQIEIFKKQLNLALQYHIPVTIHCVKATEQLLKQIELLKKITKVIFHGWSGTIKEAEFILKKGTNAYFSFGRQLLNGKKTAVECFNLLDKERVLFETDAPYQPGKNMVQTKPEEIREIIAEFGKKN